MVRQHQLDRILEGSQCSGWQRNDGRWQRPAAPCRVVRGSTDMTSCEQIRQLFTRCRRSLNDGAGCVLIDLNEVQLADTKLVACLVATYQLARASSVRIEISASGAVKDLIDICRLGWLLERTAPLG